MRMSNANAALLIGAGTLSIVARLQAADPAEEQPSAVALSATAGTSDIAPSAPTGTVRGITRNPSGLPLPKVKVIVHCGDGGPDLTAMSGTDGAFALDGLKAGHYQVTAEKDGFAPALPTPVELASAQSFNLDVTLAVAPVGSSNARRLLQPSRQGGFRLTNLYGFDYRFTAAKGYFSQQLLNNPKPDGNHRQQLWLRSGYGVCGSLLS